MFDQLRCNPGGVMLEEIEGPNQQEDWITEERFLERTQNPAVREGYVDCVIWDDEAKP